MGFSRQRERRRLWFDELEVGRVFKHAIRRTITETDNVLFTAMTHNPALTWTRSIAARDRIRPTVVNRLPSTWA